MHKLISVSSLTTMLLGSLMLPNIAAANEIVLTLKAQDVAITGEFAGFLQDAYVISTDEGNLHVPAKYVTCEGDDCLVIVAANDLTN